MHEDFPNKKRKRSRWNQDAMEQKTVIPGMPTVIPPGLTREQERAYIGKYTALLNELCIHMHTNFWERDIA
uniref:Splicing factor 1 n=1 Tax=Gopherus agassizii TaxID=38772 RepID=A0A452GNE2_9SAUR